MNFFKQIDNAMQMRSFNNNGVVNSLFGLNFGSKSKKATPESALTISAFFNGVDVISNDIAKLPKAIFKKDESGNRIRFSENPLDYLLGKSPNKKMTSFDFWKIIVLSVILKGNAYVLIVRNSVTGFEEKLIFLKHDDVEVKETAEDLIYVVKGFGNFSSDDILHFKGFSFDGIKGVSVIKYAATQLGVSLDTQEYASEIYSNQGIAYGVIESDFSVTSDNKKLIEEGFSKKMSSGNKFNVPMLDEGMKYKSISITPQESMFLETNRLAVTECCRWLNLTPVKIKDMSAGSYLNIYQQSIVHVDDSIMPWIARFEQEVDRKLFEKENKDKAYFKINEKALLRGDMDSKKNYYSTMVYAGIMTRNEVRRLEEMDDYPGLDEMLQPVNMQALSMVNNTEKNGND